MSSKRDPFWPFWREKLASIAVLAGAAGLVLPAPLAAQDDLAVTQEADGAAAEEAGEEGAEVAAPPPPATPRRPQLRGVIDLTVTVPRDESDRLLAQDCEEENEAGIISNEIVVCRELGEGTDGSWNREDWAQRYAQATQGGQPVDVAGEGIFRGPATVSGQCFIPPCPPEAAIMIDVEALPEAPPGSDADRIARGLPPLGDVELTPEQIRERRRALGLEAPPVPEE